MSDEKDAFDLALDARFSDVLLSREDMHGYQNTLVEFARENPFSLCLVDMGLGKTVSMLTLIADLASELIDNDPVLVIGPLRVATQTWPNEIREWRHLAHMNHSLIHVFSDDESVAEAGRVARQKARLEGKGAADRQNAANVAIAARKEAIRIAATRATPRIHIISRDWVEWLVEFWGPKWPYRTVIIDESSAFKDHETARFKALAKVRNHPGLMTRVHLLTATPAAETYLHLFAQVFLLDGGKRFGKRIRPYQDEFFTQSKYTRKWALRPNAEEQLLAKIADIAIVMKADEYLPMDKPEILRRAVRIGEKEMALYRTLEKDFVVTLPSGAEVEAETAAALSAKLLQMASGVLYETYFDGDIDTDDMKKVKVVHPIHDQKLDELEEIVEESQGEPILVAYHWKSSLDRLKKRFPKAVVMDKDGKCVKLWNEGKIKMLLMHPQSGGHGLNLQRGGHLMVIFDLFHSLELFLQLVGRLARQGQKHKVFVYMLTAMGTLDEAVAASLKKKEDAQENLFNILRRLIKKYRQRIADEL